MSVKIKIEETKTYEKQGVYERKKADLEYVALHRKGLEAKIQHIKKEIQLLSDYDRMPVSAKKIIDQHEKLSFAKKALEDISTASEHSYKIGVLSEEKEESKYVPTGQKIPVKPHRFGPIPLHLQEQKYRGVYALQTTKYSETIKGTGMPLYSTELQEQAKDLAEQITALEQSPDGLALKQASAQKEKILKLEDKIIKFFGQAIEHVDQMYSRVKQGLYKDRSSISVKIKTKDA